MDLVQVVGAGTASLKRWNAVLAGSASHPDGALHALVPVVVQSESTADSKALIPVVLIPTISAGRLCDLRRDEVGLELLLSLHSVEVDGLEAALGLEFGQLLAGGVSIHLVIVIVMLSEIIPEFKLAMYYLTGCLGIARLVVLQVDVLLLVHVVALSLRLGGDPGRGILVVAGVRVQTDGLLVVWHHFGLLIVEVEVSALWVDGWLVSWPLSRVLLRLADWLGITVAELLLNFLAVAVVVESGLGLLTFDLGSADDVVDLAYLSLESAEDIDGLIVDLVLLDGW